MWVPAHVGIDGNEMVDGIAKESAVSWNLYRCGALECDLCPQMKSCLLMDWQSRWDRGDMGRYAFSILSRVRLSPWFLDVVVDCPVITVISRLISYHTRVRAHLSRINIVAEALCGCGCDYETVDHILWSYPLYTGMSGSSFGLSSRLRIVLFVFVICWIFSPEVLPCSYFKKVHLFAIFVYRISGF
jgi:hypothetical protein